MAEHRAFVGSTGNRRSYLLLDPGAFLSRESDPGLMSGQGQWLFLELCFWYFALSRWLDQVRPKGWSCSSLSNHFH